MKAAVQDRGTFKGIALTLLALAQLAERAALRSFPVRFVVLAILGRAEAIARAYVAREIEARGWYLDLSCLDEPPARHCGAAAAEVLALRLRLLAAVLDGLSGADDRTDHAADHLDSRVADGSAGWPARVAPRPAVGADLPLLLLVHLPAARCGFPLKPP